MMIYPAIDIQDGKCVRLYQGHYTQATIYSDSPLTMAKQFLVEGATWLHVIDLNGAKDPSSNQAPVIKALLRSIPISIQVGGGIRTGKQIDAYFKAGAKRVIIGSLAIDSPDNVIMWLKKYGVERFVLALDVTFIDEKLYIVTQGWQTRHNLVLFDMIERFLAYNIQHLLCTDVTRDGVLNGPNIALYQNLISRFPKLHIQASGGVCNIDDIRRLKNIHVAGVIVGRALYEKKVHLSEAL